MPRSARMRTTSESVWSCVCAASASFCALTCPACARRAGSPRRSTTGGFTTTTQGERSSTIQLVRHHLDPQVRVLPAVGGPFAAGGLAGGVAELDVEAGGRDGQDVVLRGRVLGHGRRRHTACRDGGGDRGMLGVVEIVDVIERSLLERHEGLLGGDGRRREIHVRGVL